MLRKQIALWAALVMIFSFAYPASAIVRVAPSWSFTEIYVQGGSALGSYNGFPTQDFLLDGSTGFAEFDGSDLYENGLSLGIAFGRMRAGRFAFSVGFRYSNSDLTTRPLLYTRGGDEWTLQLDKVTIRQYDVDLNFNIFLLPLTRSMFSPYVGVGASAGFSQADWRDFEDENSANAALNLNFGAELQLNKPGDSRSFFALASTNTWNMVASDDRPRFLYFGGSIKYYFKGY
jgi:hypothetical protein